MTCWVHLFEGASQYWPFIAAGYYAQPVLGLLASAFSTVFVSGTSILLLTAGRPLARDETLLPNLLAVAGAFSVYVFPLPPPANISPINQYVPPVLLALGAALVLLSLLYLRRSFAVTPQARAVKQAGPYAIIRHPMYAGNIRRHLPGLLPGTPQSSLFSFVIAGLQIGRAYFEHVCSSPTPEYALYRAKAETFLPRLRARPGPRSQQGKTESGLSASRSPPHPVLLPRGEKGPLNSPQRMFEGPLSPWGERQSEGRLLLKHSTGFGISRARAPSACFSRHVDGLTPSVD